LHFFPLQHFGSFLLALQNAFNHFLYDLSSISFFSHSGYGNVFNGIIGSTSFAILYISTWKAASFSFSSFIHSSCYSSSYICYLAFSISSGVGSTRELYTFHVKSFAFLLTIGAGYGFQFALLLSFSALLAFIFPCKTPT
jgi:hypothetical protein